MDVAAAVGAERLREIMTELVNRSSAVVRRYGGTVDKFTGDGVIAVFGAPVALEDHAFRACLAALDMQQEARRLATEVQRRDGTDLRLRVGLNSGEVIAGEVGFGTRKLHRRRGAGGHGVADGVDRPSGWGDAQRVHRPSGGEQRRVRRTRAAAHQGGCRAGVRARWWRSRRIGVTVGLHTSPLVGREWELAALTAMLDRSVKGHGCVARVVGPAGIGKSRVVAEVAAAAASRGVPVFSTFCEMHASDVPLHASNRLLRAALGIEGLDDDAARSRLRSEVPGADPADLILLDDALGIADPAVEVLRGAADQREPPPNADRTLQSFRRKPGATGRVPRR